MKEMVNELKGVVESGISEIEVLNKKLSEVSGIVEMMKAGVNSDSIEAIPCICDVVLKKLYEIMDEESVQLVNKLGTFAIYLGRFDVEQEKPKRTRRPRTPKQKEEVKAVAKEVKEDKKPVAKKVEPVEKKADNVEVKK